MSWWEECAAAAEARLAAAGIRLTLGGEPTLVPLQPEGSEWTVDAVGPTKLTFARRLARDLQQRVWPGSSLLYCPGKRYDGEVNPRWSLRLFTGIDGSPPVRWPGRCQPDPVRPALEPAGAMDWLTRLGDQLGQRLRPVPLRDPLDPQRRTWAAPLTVGTDGRWQAEEWPLPEERQELTGAPGPAGLRLPLAHLPDSIPRQVLTLEIDADGWEVFLPPLNREPLENLLQAIADSLEPGDEGRELGAPRLSGVLPLDVEGHWQVLGLTADPGVLEINLPVCRSWGAYRSWLEHLEAAGERVGLRSWKENVDGREEGTGGGNHLLWGGPDLAHHPFFSRPAWLVGILRYWQHHPALAYLFCGPCVGPASQSPRPDEVASDLFDLELAYSVLEQAEDRPPPGPFGDHRELIGETLRLLHADRSGNNHRSEISFDKFWNPAAPTGCLGLVEFRALESFPTVEWSCAISLLWSALAAYLLNPEHRPVRLRPWGTALHDRMLLPSQLWADLEQILNDLAADGLTLQKEPFREIWEWRFPPLLRWRPVGSDDPAAGSPQLEIRSAPEPWPLICDTPIQGGTTSRFIDASLRCLEFVSNAEFRRQCRLRINGRPLPLEPLLAVRYRQQRLYPCLHPAVDCHVPLELAIEAPDGIHLFRMDRDQRHFESVGESLHDPSDPGLQGAWGGRRRPGDVTVDLRL